MSHDFEPEQPQHLPGRPVPPPLYPAQGAGSTPGPATASDGGPSGPGGGSFGPYGGGYGPGGWPAPGPAPTPRRRRFGRPRPAMVAVAAVATVAASAGITHAVWPSTSTTAAALSAGRGSSGSGSSGSASSGSSSAGGSSSGLGSGSGSAGLGYGYSPYGSGGTGSSGGTGTGGTGTGSAGSSAGSTEGAGGPSDVSSIAARIDGALVDVNTTFADQGASGAGTGIVLTSNGEILTNNHVIDGATSISVTDIGNGQTYKADVVGYDSTDDVAVLQLVGASGLQTARTDTAAATTGEQVVAVGNAGGTGGTPSAAGGAVTATNQSITASDELSGTSEQLAGLIEVNADVQSGDSGGSLVDTSGSVIGMDTAAASGYSLSSQSSQGYAIPIAKALTIAGQIESGKSSSTVHVGSTAFLGVLISSSGSSNADPYYSSPSGYSGSQSTTGGAPVSGTVAGGAAASAGLGAGDTITSFDGRTITSPADLSADMAQEKPGDTVQIGWTDSAGQTHTATVTLTSGPPA